MWQGPPGADNAQIRGTGVGFTYPLDRWTRGEEGLNIQSPRCCECDIPSSHTSQACQNLFFGILEQIANTISCYFLLWGDKGCWKFKLVPSIRLCCPKAGLEKTQHHKKLPHCQGLGNYPQKWILVLKRMHRLLEIMNTFALIFGGWYFRIGASCGGYFRIFHRLQNNWRKP